MTFSCIWTAACPPQGCSRRHLLLSPRVVYPFAVTFGPLMVVGASCALCGALLFASQIFRHGGLNRAHQFRVLGEIRRGEHGTMARRLLTLGAVLMPVGACLLFAGVARSDHQRAERCEERCVAEGFASGVIGPNTNRVKGDPKSRFVACICEGNGQESVEYRANQL